MCITFELGGRLAWTTLTLAVAWGIVVAVAAPPSAGDERRLAKG